MKFFKDEPKLSELCGNGNQGIPQINITGTDYGIINKINIGMLFDRESCLSFDFWIKHKDGSFSSFNLVWNQKYTCGDQSHYILNTIYEILACAQNDTNDIQKLVGRRVKTYWHGNHLEGFRFYNWHDNNELLDQYNKAKEEFERLGKEIRRI